jgi:hypothetical protein
MIRINRKLICVQGQSPSEDSPKNNARKYEKTWHITAKGPPIYVIIYPKEKIIQSKRRHFNSSFLQTYGASSGDTKW